MAKVAKVKNVSRINFTLTFSKIGGKTYEIRPDKTVDIDEDELNYLSNECQGAFDKGFLKLITKGNEVIIETHNEYSDEEMVKILGLSKTKFKAKLEEIEVSHVLQSLKAKANELEKNSTVIDAIDKRLVDITDSLVL